MTLNPYQQATRCKVSLSIKQAELLVDHKCDVSYAHKSLTFKMGLRSQAIVKIA